MAHLKNHTTGEIIAENVRYADTFWERLAGFIPRGRISPDEGLWFRDCRAIHTIGMRARIDVLFLDAAGGVLKVARCVPQQRAVVACLGARSVVELGAGALEGRDVLAGDRLILE